jgi:ribosomal protein S18 acetylase RimI-like enzyme
MEEGNIMTNKEQFEIARRQSAFESNCSADDFIADTNKVVISEDNENKRKYLELPFLCDLTSYGNCIVASVSNELVDIVKNYINKYHVGHCFEIPNMLILQEKLRPYEMNTCFMAEYFLPDLDTLKPLECNYEIRTLEPMEFEEYYLPEWSNALCEKRKTRDKLAVAAYDNNKIIGLAACSADCDSMWQIGVDVLPEYRLRGIASALTSELAAEIANLDKVPFYCCAWSNIKSVRNAIRSGFRPAWIQLTVKRNSFIEEMNK